MSHRGREILISLHVYNAMGHELGWQELRRSVRYGCISGFMKAHLGTSYIRMTWWSVGVREEECVLLHCHRVYVTDMTDLG